MTELTLTMCACGCEMPVTYDPKRKKMNKFVNGHHNRVKKVFENPDSKADRSATIIDLAWAAGFMEGEGSFCTNGKKGYPVAQAFQVEREPLDRLRSFFGGRLTMQTRTAPSNNIWCWRANGVRARGIMMTLWPMMSAKRRAQIEATLIADPTRTILPSQMRHDELTF